MSRPRAFSLRGLLQWGSPLFLAVVLRAVYLARAYEPPDTWGGDPKTYRAIADGLLAGRLVPDGYIFPPGYPVLGILLSPLGGLSTGLIAASFLSGLALPAMVLWAGRAAGLPWNGFFAALLLATDPALVDSSTRALSDSPQLALLAGTAILAVAALRTGQRKLALAAGLCGGLSALSRPESLAAVALLPVAALPAAPRVEPHRAAALGGLGATVVICVLAPYLLAFHAGTGTWGLSLKVQVNALKTDVFDQSTSFTEARVSWDRAFERYLNPQGELDPKRLAGAVSVPDFLRSPDTRERYARNLADAWKGSGTGRRLLWCAGVVGLLWAPVAVRGVRWPALATMLPFFLVPFLFPPVRRYGMAAIPAIAWGAGSLLARAQDLLERRPGWWSHLLPAVAMVTLLGVAAIVLARDARDVHWSPRQFEISVALRRGNLDAAEALVREGLRADPRDPRFHDTLGVVLDRRGDVTGAEAAYRAAIRAGSTPFGPIHLGQLLARTDRLREASQQLAGLRAHAPENHEYWALEGYLALVAQRWSDADRFYAKAEQLGEKDPNALAQHGAALLQLGRTDDANLLLRRANLAPDAGH